MKNSLLYKLNSGKNTKFLYFAKNYLCKLLPDGLYRSRLNNTLKSLENRADRDYIIGRVDYYNKLSEATALPSDAQMLSEHKLGKKKKIYFFDTYEFTRWFPKHLRWVYCPGDITYIPEYPSIVKSRPISGDNRNSVVMKLNKIRHFIFVHDTKKFTDKKDIAVFRGKVKDKATRIRFMEMYFGHPMCDLGDVDRHPECPKEWRTPKMTIREHLDYKFVLALEGNDVASNLKWVMSSNSIAVMPPPTYETWFMEGKLIPNYHYIAIKPDFSDLEERLNYYINHPNEAQNIIDNANRYVDQFRNKKREHLISLLVLNKYFKNTAQI